MDPRKKIIEDPSKILKPLYHIIVPNIIISKIPSKIDLLKTTVINFFFKLVGTSKDIGGGVPGKFAPLVERRKSVEFKREAKGKIN